MSKTLSRREFLLSAAVVAGAGLAACAPRVITEEVVVEKEVPVEVLVVETVEVASEPLVVEQLVEVEVVRVAGEPAWTPPDLSGREYLIWGLQYDPHVATYERLAVKFEELTGAKATVEPLGWPLEEHILTGLASGGVADVVCIVGKQITPLVEEGALLPVDELVYDMVGCDTDAWFGAVALEGFQVSGKTYGVPTEGSCTSGFVNGPLDLIEELGLEDMWPPLNGKDEFRSFQDMWDLAQVLQEEVDEEVLRWGLSTEGWYNAHLFGIMRTLGRDWWDPESRAFHLESDEAYEAMQLQVVDPVFNLGIETHLGEACTRSQFAGKVAIACGNATQPGTALTEADGMRVDTAVYPSAIPGRNALFVGEGGWGFIVPAEGQNTDVGIEFLKYVTTYDGQKEYARIYGGMLSACGAVLEDTELFPPNDLVGDAMRRAGVSMNRTVFYGSGYGNPSEMCGIVSTAIERVRIGEASVAEGLAEAQGQLEEMLARWDAEHA